MSPGTDTSAKVDRPRAPGSTPSVLRIVLADDHAVVRAGNPHAARAPSPDGRWSPSAATPTTAARQVRGHKPDVLVLDLAMPGRPSLDVRAAAPPRARRTPAS